MFKSKRFTLAVGFLFGLDVPLVTNALVGAQHVLAHTVRANSTGSRAFVDIFARLLVGREFVAGGTITPIRTISVDALTTSTKSGDFFTLVYV